MGVLTDDKLIDQLARHLDVPRGEAERLLHSTVGLLKSNLLQGHQLDLQGFLSLQKSDQIKHRPCLVGHVGCNCRGRLEGLVLADEDAVEVTVAAGIRRGRPV